MNSMLPGTTLERGHELVVHEGRSLADSSNPIKTHEVVAVCRLLGILEGQLRAVQEDVNTSVEGVCSRFKSMADRARSAVTSTQDAMSGGANNKSQRDLASEMWSILSTLVSNMNESSAFSEFVSRRLSDLEKQLATVNEAVMNIEFIADKMRFVALNSRIEACRLGDRGHAIAVVAKETATQASEVAKTSDSINDLVARLANEIKTLTSDIKSKTEVAVQRVASSNQLADDLQNGIHRYHEQVSALLNANQNVSEGLQSDIAHAVMSMQFQDRVSQRISHVMETLTAISSRIRPSHVDDGQEPLINQWLDSIAHQYTMESERRVHNGESQISNDSNEVSTVELF